MPSLSTNATQSPGVVDPRRAHRKVVVVCGALAIIGATLAAFVHPAWAVLAALSGLALILYPDPKS